MKMLIVLGTVALTACVTSRPVAVTLPNGTSGYAINCPGSKRDAADCTNEAARVCGGLYQVFDRDSALKGGAVPIDPSTMFVKGHDRTLIVTCLAP